MLEGRDIIVFGLQSWDLHIATTIKYTALEFSKKNRVLFVNPPLQRSFQLLRRNLPEVKKALKVLKKKEEDLVPYNENLWILYPRTILESINWIRNHRVFNYFNKINDKRFAGQIRKALIKLDFRDYILFNDNSMINGFYFKELLKPKIQVYLLRDAVTLVSYHARHGTILEPKLIRKSDVVVTNSDFFADYARKYNSNSLMIGQGCDVSLYSDPDGKMEIPPDVIPIPHPRIGYVGFLTTIRLDIDLLVHIAEQRPNWEIVLVGPEDENFKKCKLHSIPNVKFLGTKKPAELPAYVKSFDVALNPQIINPITDINYPLKIDEYLAMGKPVVATRTTFMKYFEDDTYLASSKEEYVILIEKALNENCSEKEKQRMKVAESHSWGNFVEKIYKEINKFEGGSFNDV